VSGLASPEFGFPLSPTASHTSSHTSHYLSPTPTTHSTPHPPKATAKPAAAPEIHLPVLESLPQSLHRSRRLLCVCGGIGICPHNNRGRCILPAVLPALVHDACLRCCSHRRKTHALQDRKDWTSAEKPNGLPMCGNGVAGGSADGTSAVTTGTPLIVAHVGRRGPPTL
jgi:hypothetical protein